VASAQIAEFDAKMGELESPDHLNTRKTQIQGDMRINKNKLNEYNVRYFIHRSQSLSNYLIFLSIRAI
jgi:hypothetical protein